MDDYWRDFVQESEEHITELNNSLLTLEREPKNDDAMEAIFRTAHTLKGNCGAMGLTRASNLAHAIEDLLDAVRAEEVEVTADLMDTIFDGVDELERMIEEVDDDGEIHTDPTDTIEALRAPIDEEAPPLSPPTDEEIDTTLVQFDPPTDDEHDAFFVRLSINESGAGGVNNGVLVVDALIDAFDLVGTDPPRKTIEGGSYGGTFDAVFGSAVGEAAIAAALEPVDAVDEFEIVTVTERFERLAEAETASSDTDGAAADEEFEPGSADISSDDAQEMSVDELLDEFTEFDDLDAMVEEVDDVSAFDEMGDAGSFHDLLDEDEPESASDDAGETAEADAGSGVGETSDGDDVTEPTGETAEPSADDEDDEDDEVDDASAVFAELKQEVEMVGFDELQDELDQLEFDEFDSDDEVDMDELLGDDVDISDNSFLDVSDEELEAEVDAMLADEDADIGGIDAGVEDESGVDVPDAGSAPAAETDAETSDDGSVPADADVSDDDLAERPESNEETGATIDDEIEDDHVVDDDEVFEAFAFDEDSLEEEQAKEATAEADEAARDDTSDDEMMALEGVDFGEPDDESDFELASDDGADDEEAAGRIDDSDRSLEAATDTDVPGDDRDARDDEDESGTDFEFDDELESELDDGFDDDIDDGFDDDIDDGFDDDFDDAFEDDDDAFEDDDDAFADFEYDTESAGEFEQPASEFDPVADTTGDDDLDVTDDFGTEAEAGALSSESESTAVESEDGGTSEADTSIGTEDDGRSIESGTGIGGEDGLEIPDITVPEVSEPDRKQQTDTIQSVRVDVEQIDTLLNLVEGLVTSRVRLRHAFESDEDPATMDRELDNLEDLTSELQETVMDVRLVPLHTVANRLPRVVRDIARDQEKEVAFEQTGEDVELDRSILDRIGDPLIHLVRNAVDHGIEPPDEREEAGKPREGTVELRADRSRDRVTIEIEDDGSGLDPDRLRTAAVQAGVLTETEAAELDDDEALELVFHPGLSTADEVTDVSGRGVGMDVVKRTVDELDGSVSIESDLGEGTTVTMGLPVTVAIADVLFVESGGEEFGIPTKVVQDIEDARLIETVDGQAVLADGTGDGDERDSRNDEGGDQTDSEDEGESGDEDDHTQGVPVIDLAEALETPGTGANGDGMVVRIRDDIRPVGIHCSQVHGQQEVVIKPFEGFMSGIPGLSGATVRGHGEVVNILDVNTL